MSEVRNSVPGVFVAEEDIVSKLEKGAVLLEKRFGVGGDAGIGILREAAEEIKRLRGRLKEHGE